MALLDGNNDIVTLKSNFEFSIYSLNGSDICLFVVPEKINGNQVLYLDLDNKNSYDELINGTKTKEQVVDKIEEDYNILKGTYSNAVYVVPSFDLSSLDSILSSEVVDKQAVFNSVSSIMSVTRKIESVLHSKNVSINHTINVIEKSEGSKKFALWLSNQNIGRGINYENLKSKVQNVTNSSEEVKVVENPFASVRTVSEDRENTIANNESIPNIEPTIEQTASVVVSENISNQNVGNTIEKVQEPNPVNNVNLNSPEMAIPERQQGMVKARRMKIGNKGYVNIIILMAVLVGVTFVSIQIGKFLYNIYG